MDIRERKREWYNGAALSLNVYINKNAQCYI